MLLGEVNWLMPHFKLKTGDVEALFDVCKRDANPNCPRPLTAESQVASRK